MALRSARSTDHSGTTGKRLAWPLALVGVVLGLALLFWFGSAWIINDKVPSRAILAPICISLLMACVPVMICLVQTTSKRRQLNRLDSLHDHPVYGTTYCRTARTILDAVAPATLGGDYLLPMITFVTVTASSCFIAFCSLFVEDLFVNKVALLGGMKLVQADITQAELARYQEGTFIVGCMAFLGSYVYMLGRLLDRIGNNDLAPISLHYYAARIIIAVLVAAVFRHVIGFFGMESIELPLLIGFVSGLAPDLFLLALARKAFQSVKVFGSKADPAVNARPTALPLLMLDDLTKDKVDRLNELGIDSAQVLGCQNPFLLWPKLPYDLGLLIDWIAAAQLYALVKEGGLHALRNRLVYDIFDLHIRLGDAAARGPLCHALSLEPGEADAVLRQLDSDQSFLRLREVRDALLPRMPADGHAMPEPARAG